VDYATFFVCHDISFSVAKSMQVPTKRAWSTAVHSCIGISVILAIMIGLFSFSEFGKDTQAFVLDNYPIRYLPANIARLMIVCMIAVSIPYSVFMPRMALEGIVFAFVHKEKLTKTQNTILHVVLTLTISIGALILGELVTDLGAVLEFLGGVAAAGIAFIMPPLILLALNSGRFWHPKEKLKYSLALVFGLFCIIVTTITTIQTVVENT